MNIQPFILRTTDGKGYNHLFSVTVSHEKGATHRLVDQSQTFVSYDFKVNTDPAQQDGVHFQLTLVQYNDGLLRVDTVDNHNSAAFVRKGIMPALIKWIAQHFNRPVESSSDTASGKRLRNESRNQNAEVVWQKIVERGQATYDQGRDVYVYT